MDSAGSKDSSSWADIVQEEPTSAPGPAQKQVPRQQFVASRSWSAVKPDEIPAGCTYNPKTGKIYQLAPSKERTDEYLRISRNYEAARLAVVAYCNDNQIIFDIESKCGFQVEPDQSRKWLKPSVDPVYDSLKSAADKAKKALHDYKSSHKDEFRPLPKGRKNNSSRPTMQVVGLPKKTTQEG